LSRPPEEQEAPRESATEVRYELGRLLQSEHFSKAQRMSKLIKFLIEAELAGSRLDEYSVGIGAFGRDPRSYSTGEDPIVRVQMGRLRDRLTAFYAQTGAAANLRFSVPLGRYRPLITRVIPNPGRRPPAMLLCVAPLAYGGSDAAMSDFVSGLNEELSFSLFGLLAHALVPNRLALSGAMTDKLGSVTHALEGNVRASGELTRVSLRLVDLQTGCLAWLEQFDHDRQCDIKAQAALAQTMCFSLQRHLAHR
jgi:hypothetical protein